MIAVYVCRDPEEAWIRSLIEEQEREFAEHERERDRETELEMARAEVYGDAECPWPWYADAPCEVQEPEVFGP